MDLPPDIWADLLEEDGQDTSLLRSILSYDIAQQGKEESLYSAGFSNGMGCGTTEDSWSHGWGYEWSIGNHPQTGHGNSVGARGIPYMCVDWGDA